MAKVIRDIIQSDIAPRKKNVLWIDTSSRHATIKTYNNGKWAFAGGIQNKPIVINLTIEALGQEFERRIPISIKTINSLKRKLEQGSNVILNLVISDDITTMPANITIIPTFQIERSTMHIHWMELTVEEEAMYIRCLNINTETGEWQLRSFKAAEV